MVLLALGLAFRVSGFPRLHASLLMIAPAMLGLWGMYETSRCLRLRWSLYHGGVLLLLYMDIMALAMIFFLMFYPYAGWLQ